MQHSVTAQRVVAIDEFEKGEVFVMSHLLMTPKQAAMAAKRWEKLQREIKDRLVKRGGKAAEKLQGDTLPEIHAEWLIQSQKYYRWQGSPINDYWREHLEWLTEAMRIIRHAGPVIFYGAHINYAQKETERLKAEGLWEDQGTIDHFGREAYEDVIRFLLNPYARGLALSIAALEHHFRRTGSTYEIICDDYDYCKGFATLEVFSKLAEHQLVQAGSAPVFLSSEEQQLIQMADVAAYGGGQVQWLRHRRRKDPAFTTNERIHRVVRDHQKYLLPLDGEGGSSPAPRGRDVDVLVSPIYLDMARHHCRRSPELTAQLLHVRDERIQSLLQPK